MIQASASMYFQLTVFASVFATLYAAHQVGDHWVQTHWQACGKADRTPQGQFACLAHVTSLTLTKMAALALLWLATGLDLRNPVTVVALLMDAASHYWADRRWALRDLAARLGKSDFYQLGLAEAAPCGTGAYALDQSWHVGWLFATSLIIAWSA